MSELKQATVVRYAVITIQLTTIAEYTRRFLTSSYKTSHYLAFREIAEGLYSLGL